MFSVRTFQPKDMFSVIKIASETLTERYNPTIFNYFYETFPEYFVVAESAHKIIGFIIGAEINSTKIKILMLSVSKNYRRKKVGNTLLNEFEKMILKKGINDIELEVRTKNKTAIKFYQKNGYKIEDKMENYYQNGENAYIMRKIF